MSPKVVTIVGATGQQGKAVIAAFANNPEYHIRGLTREPDGPGAKELAAQGIEIVRADINDIYATTAAFKGSHIIFAVTDFWALFQMHGYMKAKDVETEQAINMARAASATSTLEHYIWSTLPKGNKDYPVYHFESKSVIDDFIRKDPVLLAKTTFLMVCFYGNNLQIASFRPYWINTVNKYVQFTTYDPETVIPFIGDVSNLTPFVKAIVGTPEKVKNGTMVIGSIGQWTAKKWVEEWAAGKGAKVQLMRVSRKDYDSLFPWPRWSEEFALMMDYFRFVPLQEWIEPGVNILTAEHLNVTPVQTLEEWAKTYELPDASLSTI
ncbi:hypothetical protein N7510_010472 [Penicillium lagena]|uniref:uncharacterized protein n=1 Tax=Penicillium lagena TaxID=94218 RepID=UPI0025419D27|nr:uncharacterized protein N7510_010472 [Penicillium lagena]KAJ5605318.1 hypothetical protein N7510_010472 [Penicillium lagena]